MGGFFYFSIYYCSFAKKIVMNIRKFAGIDIGSNGVRLLIANILEEEGKTPIFSKGSLVRVPIRLGADVFEQGRISAENASRLSDTMQAYHLLMKEWRLIVLVLPQPCARLPMAQRLSER